MLFGMQKFETFPIDVWVERVINEIYPNKEKTSLNKKEIEILAKEKYGSLARDSTTILILLEKK
jgi:N-glycosylase/DNA lyase